MTIIRRQPRVARRLGVTVKITPRDEALVRALARFGAARTPDVLRLLFAGIRPDTAARRLRRAFDGGILAVRAGDRAQPNIYTLGERGKAFARAHGIAVSRVPRGDLDHHLRVISFWTALASFCHGRRDLRLRSFTPDWERRRSVRPDAAAAIPDALVELAASGSAMIRFALEVDCGGERAKEWRAKLDRYLTLLANDNDRVGLVVLSVGGERRRSSLEGLVNAAWPGWFVVADADQEEAEVVDRIFERSGTPLTSSPFGKGSGNELSGSEASRFESKDEGP